MLNLFVLMKRSKNTKGKAEHVSHFLLKRQRSPGCVVLSAGHKTCLRIHAGFQADPVPCPASVLLQDCSDTGYVYTSCTFNVVWV